MYYLYENKNYRKITVKELEELTKEYSVNPFRTKRIELDSIHEDGTLFFALVDEK